MIIAMYAFYAVLLSSTVRDCLAAEASLFDHYKVALAGRHDILHVDTQHNDIQQNDSLKGLLTTLSINDSQRKNILYEYHNLFIVMLNVVLLSVFMLSVVVLSVVMLSIVMPSFLAPFSRPSQKHTTNKTTLLGLH